MRQLEQQLKEKSEREQKLHDELEDVKLQLQQQQKLAEDYRLREESQKSSPEERGSKKSVKHEQEWKDVDKGNTDEVGVVGLRDEIKSAKEREYLMEKLKEALREMAEKTDQKHKELSQKAEELSKQIADFAFQTSTTSPQDKFHHKWQMVNDLDTLSKQPDVASLSRKEFKQKVIEMVKEKWVPRNREHLQTCWQSLQLEMAAQCKNSVRSLIEDVIAAIRHNMDRSLELVDQLKTMSEEQKS